MKRGIIVCLVLFLIVCVGIFLAKPFVGDSDEEGGQQMVVENKNSDQPIRSIPPEFSPNEQNQKKLPGDEILSGYGQKSQTPQRDIEQVKELVANSMWLIKNRDPREYATNEDLAEFLMGNNQFKQPMLSKNHSIINEQGQLVDRWGKPLIVHVVSRREVEIFGPGPDGIGWNSDDIGRSPQ